MPKEKELATQKPKKLTLISYFKKQIKSFSYAFRGITFAFADYNFLIHIPAAILILIFAWYFEIKILEWLFLISAIFAVWISETFNCSIEILTDMVSPDFHKMAGKVKDLAAGAVLMAVIYAIIVAGIIFTPHFLNIIL